MIPGYRLRGLFKAGQVWYDIDDGEPVTITAVNDDDWYPLALDYGNGNTGAHSYEGFLRDYERRNEDWLAYIFGD